MFGSFLVWWIVAELQGKLISDLCYNYLCIIRVMIVISGLRGQWKQNNQEWCVGIICMPLECTLPLLLSWTETLYSFFPQLCGNVSKDYFSFLSERVKEIINIYNKLQKLNHHVRRMLVYQLIVYLNRCVRQYYKQLLQCSPCFHLRKFLRKCQDLFLFCLDSTGAV